MLQADLAPCQFYIDEITYSGTSQAIPIHLAADHTLIPFAELPSHFPPIIGASQLTTNTGTGTDHDDPSLRPRTAYLFEAAYEAPTMRFGSKGWLRDVVTRRAPAAVMKWLGLVHTVYDRRVEAEDEVFFDLRRGRAGGWELPRAVKLEKVEEE